MKKFKEMIYEQVKNCFANSKGVMYGLMDSNTDFIVRVRQDYSDSINLDTILVAVGGKHNEFSIWDVTGGDTDVLLSQDIIQLLTDKIIEWVVNVKVAEGVKTAMGRVKKGEWDYSNIYDVPYSIGKVDKENWNIVVKNFDKQYPYNINELASDNPELMEAFANYEIKTAEDK